MTRQRPLEATWTRERSRPLTLEERRERLPAEAGVEIHALYGGSGAGVRGLEVKRAAAACGRSERCGVAQGPGHYIQVRPPERSAAAAFP